MTGIAEVAARIQQIQAHLNEMSGRFSASVGGPGFAGALDAAQSTGSAGSATGGSAAGALVPDSTGPTGRDVVADAKKYLGVPYVFGSTDPSRGLDCSSLVQRVFKDLGVDVPRLVRHQLRAGDPVSSLKQARPGDLLIFDGHEHIGIYVGDGKMLHAPQPGQQVKIGPIYETPTAIRRLLPPEPSPTTSFTAADALLRSAALGQGGLSPTALSALGGSTLVGSVGSVSPGSSGLGADASSGLGADALVGAALGVGNTDNDDASADALALAGTGGAGSTSSAIEGTLRGVPYAGLFTAAGGRHGVSPRLLAAVAKVESNYDPDAVSGAGARGLMQIMPATARELGIDPLDPAEAVDGAARLLQQHLDAFGSLPLALAAYNAGGGAVHRYGGIPPYAETRAYVGRVQSALRALGRDES